MENISTLDRQRTVANMVLKLQEITGRQDIEELRRRAEDTESRVFTLATSEEDYFARLTNKLAKIQSLVQQQGVAEQPAVALPVLARPNEPQGHLQQHYSPKKVQQQLQHAVHAQQRRLEVLRHGSLQHLLGQSSSGEAAQGSQLGSARAASIQSPRGAPQLVPLPGSQNLPQAGVVIELEVDDSSTSNAAGQELVSLLTFSESNVIDSMSQEVGQMLRRSELIIASSSLPPPPQNPNQRLSRPPPLQMFICGDEVLAQVNSGSEQIGDPQGLPAMSVVVSVPAPASSQVASPVQRTGSGNSAPAYNSAPAGLAGSSLSPRFAQRQTHEGSKAAKGLGQRGVSCASPPSSTASRLTGSGLRDLWSSVTSSRDGRAEGSQPRAAQQLPSPVPGAEESVSEPTVDALAPDQALRLGAPDVLPDPGTGGRAEHCVDGANQQPSHDSLPPGPAAASPGSAEKLPLKLPRKLPREPVTVRFVADPIPALPPAAADEPPGGDVNLPDAENEFAPEGLDDDAAADLLFFAAAVVPSAAATTGGSSDGRSGRGRGRQGKQTPEKAPRAAPAQRGRAWKPVAESDGDATPGEAPAPRGWKRKPGVDTEEEMSPRPAPAARGRSKKAAAAPAARGRPKKQPAESDGEMTPLSAPAARGRSKKPAAESDGEMTFRPAPASRGRSKKPAAESDGEMIPRSAPASRGRSKIPVAESDGEMTPPPALVARDRSKDLAVTPRTREARSVKPNVRCQDFVTWDRVSKNPQVAPNHSRGSRSRAAPLPDPPVEESNTPWDSSFGRRGIGSWREFEDDPSFWPFGPRPAYAKLQQMEREGTLDMMKEEDMLHPSFSLRGQEPRAKRPAGLAVEGSGAVGRSRMSAKKQKVEEEEGEEWGRLDALGEASLLQKGGSAAPLAQPDFRLASNLASAALGLPAGGSTFSTLGGALFSRWSTALTSYGDQGGQKSSAEAPRAGEAEVSGDPSQTQVAAGVGGASVSTAGMQEEFICPLTQELFVDPVIAADGSSYERSAIEDWLSRKKTSPMTNEPFLNDTLTPNDTLRAAVKGFLESKQA